MATRVTIGQILHDTYRIERQLGSGGMAAVYEASHLRLPRRFAVKVLLDTVAEDHEAVARFAREAQVTSSLGHANIVEVIDFHFTADGQPYLVMELLRGEDLSQRLLRPPRLTLEEMDLVLCQVASALDATHSRGIIHRDLKPSNLFLCSKTRRLKVLDFGMSKVMRSNTRLTAVEEIIGTPYYMAPEQISGEPDSINERTDIYAMGAILFEMLTAQPPFTGSNVFDVLNQVLRQPAPPVSRLRGDLPPGIDEVLQRTLAKRSDERPSSAGDLAHAFARAAGTKGPQPRSQGLVALSDPLPPPSQECTLPSSQDRTLPPLLLGDRPGWEVDTPGSFDDHPTVEAVASPIDKRVGESVDESEPTGEHLLDTPSIRRPADELAGRTRTLWGLGDQPPTLPPEELVELADDETQLLELADEELEHEPAEQAKEQRDAADYAVTEDLPMLDIQPATTVRLQERRVTLIRVTAAVVVVVVGLVVGAVVGLRSGDGPVSAPPVDTPSLVAAVVADAGIAPSPSSEILPTSDAAGTASPDASVAEDHQTLDQGVERHARPLRRLKRHRRPSPHRIAAAKRAAAKKPRKPHVKKLQPSPQKSPSTNVVKLDIVVRVEGKNYPWIPVAVDGRVITNLPVRHLPVSPGVHVIQVVHKDYLPSRIRVLVVGETRRIKLETRRR